MNWVVVAISLVVVTVGLYLPVGGHDFVGFDDPLYITENSRVARGLTLESLGWAFTSGDAFIWHPLTWISYLLDASLYGTQHAGPWLLTNVGLHGLNVFLLFFVLFRISAQALGSSRLGVCAIAVALFALHPIQVESVAWASSRKELLAGTFLLVTLLAYAEYARRPSRARYAWVFVAMAASLMSKGSHVALPVGLLLLDVWPLGRLQWGADFTRTLRELAVEKLPLLMLSVGSIVPNLVLVAGTHNPWVTDPDFVSRVGSAAINLVSYLGRLIAPTEFAVVYPNSLQVISTPASVGELGLALLVVSALTVLALLGRKRRPDLVFGWGWFVVMLLPMLGLIPMGLRTPHDRYAYVPMIGLAVVIGVSGVDLVRRGRLQRIVGSGLAIVAVVALALVSRQQIGVWRESIALFDHALEVTERSALVHNAKGTALAGRGEVDSAIAEFTRALEIHPKHASSLNNLGYLLVQRGDTSRGIGHLSAAVEVRPGWTRARLNLGRALLEHGDVQEAVSTFEEAVAFDPDSAPVRSALGVALTRASRSAEAIEVFRAALRLDPEDPTARAVLRPKAPAP